MSHILTITLDAVDTATSRGRHRLNRNLLDTATILWLDTPHASNNKHILTTLTDQHGATAGEAIRYMLAGRRLAAAGVTL